MPHTYTAAELAARYRAGTVQGFAEFADALHLAEVSRERDALHALCLTRNEELARVDRELMGIRSQRDARTQALTESGDKLCRAENERDALRDALRRADNILRGLDETGAYSAGLGEKVAKLLG